MTYSGCLDFDELLVQRVARIVGADYQAGSYEAAELRFIESGDAQQHWLLYGEQQFRLQITFEKYEGYYFYTISGDGDNIQLVLCALNAAA